MTLRIILFTSLLIIGCNEDVPKNCTQTISSTVWTSLDQTQLTADIQAIDDYLVSISKTALEDVSGIRYNITKAGEGDSPCLESRLKVNYTGVFMSSGNVFDEGANVRFRLNNLIAGWQIAFLKLNRGTEATLYIPSGLAYGASSNGTISANSNLIFLVDF
jgi:FKBP-type peptidyl-prolyl cis-trans isomerase FkpA